MQKGNCPLCIDSLASVWRLLSRAEICHWHFIVFVEEGYVKMFLRGRPVTMYMPKDQVDSYSLEAKAELPTKRLKLEWVYPLFADQIVVGDFWKSSGRRFIKVKYFTVNLKKIKFLNVAT